MPRIVQQLALWRRTACLIVPLAASIALASRAEALPLTTFRYQAQAQRYCPDDRVVWLDFSKERYYRKGQRQFGQGSTGSFVCEREARAGRFRRSLLGLR
jgi:hypothetical protein